MTGLMTDQHLELSARAQRFADVLAAWPRRRVQLTELWKILDQADPATRVDARRRMVLSELIDELSGANMIELPASRSYDRSEDPRLPRFVTLPRPAADPGLAKPVVWHPALAWVPQARLSRSQTGTLDQVNSWLHDNRDQLVVPSRERSLEIFGNEKALDRLVITSLFGPGRLDLGLLRCRRVAPRLHCETAGAGDVLLVVENSDTFDSVLSVLRDRDDHRVGLVGWGAGTGFEASVLSIARLGRPVAEIRYFGDLDENGLRVPANAGALARTEGLPRVLPAAALYAAMLQLGVPQPGQRKRSAEGASDLASWLDPEHRGEAERLLMTGSRIAQEAVGLAHLSRHDEWLRDLM
jgi:hypothetical protein